MGWKSGLEELLTPEYRLAEVMRADQRSALVGGFHGDTPVLINAMRVPPDEAETILRRFMEARYLDHPNLLRVIDAGKGGGMVWSVAEAAEGSLAAQSDLTDPELWALTGDLIAGLRYVHGEGLVYSALRADTVYRSGGHWKLGDFHQLRLPGQAKVSETRALMGRMPEVPPEAFEGLISPAWDVWSFGVSMGKVIRRRGSSVDRMDGLIGRCLDSNPEARITIDELAAELAPARPIEASSPPPVVTNWQPRHGVGPAPSYLGIEGGEPPREPHQEPVARRRWLPFAVAGAALGVLLTVFATRGHQSAPQPKPVASTAAPASGAPAKTEPSATSSGTSAKAINKPDPAAPPESGESDRVNPASIQGVLNRWVSSIRERDVNGQMECYAPVVTRFYGRRNLDARQLRAEKQRQFASIGTVKKFDVSGLKVTPVNSELAIANFKKTWDFGSFAGSEQDEMTLRYLKGEWKIAGETGKRLYWVRRGSSGQR